MGSPMDESLTRTGILLRILAQASAGKLDRVRLAGLFRARRKDLTYLRTLLKRLESDGRLYLNALLGQYVMARRPGPRFRKSVRAAYEKARELGRPMPERTVD